MLPIGAWILRAAAKAARQWYEVAGTAALSVAVNLSTLQFSAIDFVVAFLIMAFIVYFFIVKPYELAKEKFVKSEEEDAAPNADTVLLTEIRDALLRDRA